MPADPTPCPKCGAAMRIARRAPHTLRPGYERQTLECIGCEFRTLLTVAVDETPAQ